MEPGTHLIEGSNAEALSVPQPIEEAPVAGGALGERGVGKAAPGRKGRNEAQHLGAKQLFHENDGSRLNPTLQSDFANLQSDHANRIIPTMPMSLPQFVKLRLAEIGRDPFEAARIGGLKRTFVYDIMHGAEDRTVRGNNLEALAKALDTTAVAITEALTGVTPEAPPSRAAGEIQVVDVPPPHMLGMPQNVPIHGTAAGSGIGLFEGFNFEDGQIGYARRPPGLSGAKDAYAIYIVNDSMWPEHKAGDLRFVTPHRPPAPGDTVIIQVRADEDAPLQAFIKTFVKRTSSAIVVSQHNPPATMEFSRETVVAMHRVPSLNDLYGV
jgi:phage repressor protein C with HTH and peptisase S24 domain